LVEPTVYLLKNKRGQPIMQLSKEEIEILTKLRDARISKNVLIEFTQIMKDIIAKRPLTKNKRKTT
jgi:hypothetical protein